MNVPLKVQQNARRGLALRRQWGRGGTEVGEATAKKLASGKVSQELVDHISKYFPRHAGDRLEADGSDGRAPSNGYIAWLLWGGDEGRKWSSRKKNPMKSTYEILIIPAGPTAVRVTVYRDGATRLDKTLKGASAPAAAEAAKKLVQAELQSPAINWRKDGWAMFSAKLQHKEFESVHQSSGRMPNSPFITFPSRDMAEQFAKAAKAAGHSSVLVSTFRSKPGVMLGNMTHKEANELVAELNRRFPGAVSKANPRLKAQKNPYMGFKKLTSALRRKGAEDPKALAAWIGRKKYGKAEFQRMAAAGKRKNPEQAAWISPQGEAHWFSARDTHDLHLPSNIGAKTMRMVFEKGFARLRSWGDNYTVEFRPSFGGTPAALAALKFVQHVPPGHVTVTVQGPYGRHEAQKDFESVVEARSFVRSFKGRQTNPIFPVKLTIGDMVRYKNRIWKITGLGKSTPEGVDRIYPFAELEAIEDGEELQIWDKELKKLKKIKPPSKWQMAKDVYRREMAAMANPKKATKKVKNPVQVTGTGAGRIRTVGA